MERRTKKKTSAIFYQWKNNRKLNGKKLVLVFSIETMAQEKSFVFSSTMESICTSLGLYVTVNNKLPICKSLGPCITVNNSMRETRKNVKVVQPLPFPPLKLANASKEKEQIPKVMADDKPTLEPLLEWFEALIEGTIGQELETRALQGLSITKAEKGFIRTEFTVPSVAAVSQFESNYTSFFVFPFLP